MSGSADLVDVLTKKRDALQSLQLLLIEENELITQLDSEGLRLNSARKLVIFETIAALNERCRLELESACREVQVTEGNGLSSLMAALKQPERETLRTLQATIIGAAQKTQHLLEINKDLLETSLQFMANSMNLFRGFFSKTDIYSQNGRMMSAAPAPQIVCKEM